MPNFKHFISFLITFALFVSCNNENLNEKKEITFKLPKNFVLEELYQPSANDQGSWVAMAQGPNNVMYTCDQYGKIYYFNTPAIGKTLELENVKALELNIGEAHGLLWAHNSLYVAVNKKWNPDENEYGSGIYRITDNNHDGQLDKVEMLLKLEGEGEHGPHSFALSPDGNEIYFIAGNHTLIPDVLKDNSRLPTNWGEDNLFEPYLDARGHANDIKAPGGWVAKFNPDGTNWELISAGFRNAFDIAFNEDGELFTYDADMEWDIGMPWYRPTRICHVTSGGEFGWRTGSGKWPTYYPDALPAVHNLEQGSPTAVLSGMELNFPDKYSHGLLVMDWSFGTIYFVNLNRKGSSYSAEREEFLSGAPLPLTDMIAGSDGNLYFATGGRRIDSHFYRLRYVGDDIMEAQIAITPEEDRLRKLRNSIENYHKEKSPKGVDLAWQNLNHQDRHIRYASRIVLENQSINQWYPLFIKEKDSKKLIEASIALARQGDSSLQSKILAKLNSITLETQLNEFRLGLLRAYELLFIRMGKPNVKDRLATVKKLNNYFPHEDKSTNRELGQLLLFLGSEGITDGLVDLLEKYTQEGDNDTSKYLSEETTLRSEQYGPLIREILEKMPPTEAIYYGVLLSHADKGWTKKTREKYFQWFYDVLNAKGGLSFKPAMENIRIAAMKHVPENEKEYFQELSGIYSPSSAIADLPQPFGPGKTYTGKDMGDIGWGGKMDGFKPNFEKGKRAYNAAMCVLCHRMRGEGGASGPDLTQAHTKFNRYSLAFSIFSPNDEISDQYANTLFNLKDNKKIAGRIKSEEGDSIVVMPNPFNETYTISIAKNDVLKRGISPVSPMPPGLLNRLNEEEVFELLMFIESGGNEKHEIYSSN